MRSPIKYFGGKGSMYKEIIKHFPPPGKKYDIYIEPFGGSYTVGIHAGTGIPVEIYNDLEQNVYTFYKVLSNKDLFRQFKERCDLVYYMADLRVDSKILLQQDLLPVERAFYFFYLNRTSRQGIGGLSVNLTIRRHISKGISDMLSSIDMLPELHERLSKVIVLNQDGISLMRKYSRSDTFIYCDPPYEQSTRTTTRYKVDMDRQKQIEFLNACIESKAMLLISGYDCELYSILTDNNFTKIQFDINTVSGVGKKKKKTETLWKNY